VKLEREVSDGWLVRTGLNDGDRVITDGLMRVRPGGPVKPMPLDAKKDDAQAPPPAPKG
jgi:membrane fusion protein (multidrug efflux system)